MFFAALGLIELIFFGVFFLMLIVGAESDRRGSPEIKWYVFLIGLIAMVAWFWNDWTFQSVWDTVKSLEFWKPVAAYLGAGLVYSLLEFFLVVRKSARFFAEKWQKHLGDRQSVRDGSTSNVFKVSDLYTKVRDGSANDVTVDIVKNLSESFARKYQDDDYIINLKIDKTTNIDVQPFVNRKALANHVSAWTFFWPAYALSLILGDLLTEVFRMISDFIANISTRLVKITFANVFKF